MDIVVESTDLSSCIALIASCSSTTMAAKARQAYAVLVREGKTSYKLLLIRYFLESQL
jgi:hypothetical protein